MAAMQPEPVPASPLGWASPPMSPSVPGRVRERVCDICAMHVCVCVCVCVCVTYLCNVFVCVCACVWGRVRECVCSHLSTVVASGQTGFFLPTPHVSPGKHSARVRVCASTRACAHTSIHTILFVLRRRRSAGARAFACACMCVCKCSCMCTYTYTCNRCVHV